MTVFKISTFNHESVGLSVALVQRLRQVTVLVFHMGKARCSLEGSPLLPGFLQGASLE